MKWPGLLTFYLKKDYDIHYAEGGPKIKHILAALATKRRPVLRIGLIRT
jgi:hypothetical protein